MTRRFKGTSGELQEIIKQLRRELEYELADKMWKGEI